MSDEEKQEAQASRQRRSAKPAESDASDKSATLPAEVGADKSENEPAIEELTREQIDELKQKARERDEIWDRFLRTAAEFENRRKRLEQDAERRIRYAQQSLLKDLLPVLADLSRALETCEVTFEPQETQSAVKTIADGIRLVEKRLHDVLARHNVSRIKTVGEKFDPNLHEALSAVPTDEQPPGTILQEIEPGWMLEDRVVKAAKVVVAAATKDPSMQLRAGEGRGDPGR